ncbi:uncharacterized protein HD556DRAFT_1450755 [Suillus plorans]|uniref:Uncharacterized protein n=1 Tax=Suillus plorans TaxID=116603 RepID=A0A9P7AC42_9AGAM|nr:uncharacterized protein HD556DRAFT_1450755 [Suillus plorans]KAG1785442.1 hypothetical protein HD556DRAFT_1450755 [Suillus plorans]
MCPAVDPRFRSSVGGVSYNQPPVDTAANCSPVTSSGPCQCMRRALRRLGKEDLVTHVPSSDLASLFALGVENLEVPPRSTRNRKSSSSSVDDTLYALRSVRRLLDTSETVCPVSGKTIPSHHAANNPTASPTKTSSRKSSVRRLQRSLSSTVDSAAETAIFQAFLFALSNRDSDYLGNLEPHLKTTVNDTPKKYPLPLENISMKVSCDERHVTTWDEPDHAFHIFPAQLLIACTSTHDFDPLLVPAVTLVHLKCSTVARNGPYKSHSQISFKTFYDGATIRYLNDKPTPDLSRGIHIGEVPWCSTKDGDGNVGWCMLFWIPIPFALFQRAETRTFKINAKVHVDGDGGKEGYLSASSDFTLSRLLRGLAM